MVVNVGLNLDEFVVIFGIGCLGCILGYINLYGVYSIYGCVFLIV